jgi:hypothetical protein
MGHKIGAREAAPMAILMRNIWKVGGAVLLTFFIGETVFAADDEALVRILTRADVAHNLTAYCAQFDPSILQQTRGTQGEMRGLMQHITSEVISGLPADEASRVE